MPLEERARLDRRRARLCRMAGHIAAGLVQAGVEADVVGTRAVRIALDIERDVSDVLRGEKL